VKNPVWSILILTMPPRAAMLARLMDVLEPQVKAANSGVQAQRDAGPNRAMREGTAERSGFPEKVELIIRESDANLPVGENREALRQRARGEYISFLDDDDLVPPHFVERILPCLDGVDYVGFNQEQHIDGAFICIERRSLRFGRVGRIGAERFRDISHINPMRRELALAVPMTGWPAEDIRWADEIRKLSIVRTEHYLDETLYYYLTRTRKPEMKGLACPLAKEPYPWRLMKKVEVKMLTSIAGLANPMYDLPDHCYAFGDIVEVHPNLAEAWIQSGIAEAVTTKGKEKEAKPAESKESKPAEAKPATEAAEANTETKTETKTEAKTETKTESKSESRRKAAAAAETVVA
jgi:hypothetical protein